MFVSMGVEEFGCQGVMHYFECDGVESERKTFVVVAGLLGTAVVPKKREDEGSILR